MNIANLLSTNMITYDSGLQSVKGEKIARGDFVTLLMNMVNVNGKVAKDAISAENIITQLLQMLSNGADSEECLSLLDGVDIEVLEEVANLIGVFAGISEEESIVGAKSPDEDSDKEIASDDLTQEMQTLVTVAAPIHIPDDDGALISEHGSKNYRIGNTDIAKYGNITDAGAKVHDSEQSSQGIDVSGLANIIDGETFKEVSNAVNNALSDVVAHKVATEVGNPISNGAKFGTGESVPVDNAILEESNIEITKVSQDRTVQMFERSSFQLRPEVVRSDEATILHKAQQTVIADNVQPIDVVTNPDMDIIDVDNQAQVIIKEPAEQIAMEITNQLTTLEKEGSTKIQMKLEPESLGKVVIEMTLESGKMAVKITAESQIASAMLAERANDLTHGLKGQGITLESYNVSYENHDANSSFTNKNPQYSQSRNAFTVRGDYNGEVSDDYVDSPSGGLNLYA